MPGTHGVSRFVRLITLALPTLIPVASCTSRHAATAAEPEGVVLEVENRNWSDIVVYVVHDGRTNRFMTITAARIQSVPLASRLIGSNGVVRFIAHRIGGEDDYYSPAVSVRTGATVALTLLPELNMSSVGVW